MVFCNGLQRVDASCSRNYHRCCKISWFLQNPPFPSLTLFFSRINMFMAIPSFYRRGVPLYGLKDSPIWTIKCPCLLGALSRSFKGRKKESRLLSPNWPSLPLDSRKARLDGICESINWFYGEGEDINSHPSLDGRKDEIF